MKKGTKQFITLIAAVFIFVGTLSSCNTKTATPDNDIVIGDKSNEISLGQLKDTDDFYVSFPHLTVGNFDIDFPEIEPPASLPVYKCRFMESSAEYAADLAEAFEFEKCEFVTKDEVLPGTKNLKVSSVKLGENDYDSMSAYSNGSIFFKSSSDNCHSVNFDFRNKSDSEITDEVKMFVDKFNYIFHMGEYEISILERNSDASCVTVEIKEKTTDSDENRIKIYNGISKRIKIYYECYTLDSEINNVELSYTTDDYLEEEYEADISSWDDNKKNIDAGEGLFVPLFSTAYFRSSSGIEEDSENRINDRIVDTPVQIIYVYDTYGYYRPLYIYEKTSDTDRVFSVSGYDHVHSTKYFEAVDPVVSLSPNVNK